MRHTFIYNGAIYQLDLWVSNTESLEKADILGTKLTFAESYLI